MKILASAALVAGLASGCVISTNDDSSLLVSNESSFEIHELYVTNVHSASWGSNLLRGDVLLPGESTYISLDCGTYDAMLIDETDSSCEVAALQLCFQDADWIIRNNSCPVFSAALAAAAKK